MIGNLLGASQVFDIGLKNPVKDVVRRQAVLVLLVGTQFGRRRLLDSRPGDQFPVAVNSARQFIHHQFWYSVQYPTASSDLLPVLSTIDPNLLEIAIR
jgi:hypothetical protein